ncbi:hypothetical protein PROFUN_02671 [Planoprotostelium fungivorum]|uniref:Uncharacterized protein n=1 Tax=Planoprotostelium fungivorum TaxID=1890364 RepID=A0A2P6NVD6_9EUKA|nr:hypothetical protein PROFUN_02671 [Planoprotostelium fungivorum]
MTTLDEKTKELAAYKGRKAILLPGNDCMWYPWIAQQLSSIGVPCILTSFPDSYRARESIWKPFVVDTLGANEETILVGHSSGAAIIEDTKVFGVVLISSYTSDLGDANERSSGYFNREWNWEKMKQNAKWVIQYHSRDDHLVPISEGRKVHENLGTKYYEQEYDGHFQDDEVPGLLEAIQEKIKTQ